MKLLMTFLTLATAGFLWAADPALTIAYTASNSSVQESYGVYLGPSGLIHHLSYRSNSSQRLIPVENLGGSLTWRTEIGGSLFRISPQGDEFLYERPWFKQTLHILVELPHSPEVLWESNDARALLQGDGYIEQPLHPDSYYVAKGTEIPFRHEFRGDTFTETAYENFSNMKWEYKLDGSLIRITESANHGDLIDGKMVDLWLKSGVYTVTGPGLPITDRKVAVYNDFILSSFFGAPIHLPMTYGLWPPKGK